MKTVDIPKTEDPVGFDAPIHNDQVSPAGEVAPAVPVHTEQEADQPVRPPRERFPESTQVEREPGSAIAWPKAVTHVSFQRGTQQGADVAHPVQEDFPTVPPPVTELPKAPARELHVKVWDQEEEPLPTAPVPSTSEPEESIDHLPTQPMLDALSVPLSGANRDGGQEDQEAPRPPQQPVEQLDTVPFIPTIPREVSVAPQPADYQIVRENTPLPASLAQPRPERISQQQTTSPVAPTPQQERPPSIPSRGRSAAASEAHLERPRPLVLALVVLALLIIVGGCWIIVAQPFAVPQSTEPLQHYTNTNLGFSLQYPSDWMASVEKQKSLVQFYDSNHTDQVNVTVTSSTTNDLKQYLQQQASQLGMKNVQTVAPISFGGASWQQVQGSLLQSGETYTGKLLATVHGTHLYLLAQFAPNVTFNDEESAVFSAMREAWSFL